MPPISYAAADLFHDLGGPSLPSTASSPRGLSSFSSPHPGEQIFLEISDLESYPSDSEVSHILSEEVETAMTADDIPDTMVDSALSLDALSRFLHENRDAIEGLSLEMSHSSSRSSRGKTRGQLLFSAPITLFFPPATSSSSATSSTSDPTTGSSCLASPTAEAPAST